MNLNISAKTFRATAVKPKPKSKLADNLNPSKSEFYSDDFRADSSWAVSGQKDSLGLDDLALLARKQGDLEVTFQRNVPDETKPNSKLTQVGRGLAVGLATTLAVAATVFGIPAAPFFGVVEGVKEYKNSAFKPKSAELSGTLQAKNDHVYFFG